MHLNIQKKQRDWAHQKQSISVFCIFINNILLGKQGRLYILIQIMDLNNIDVLETLNWGCDLSFKLPSYPCKLFPKQGPIIMAGVPQISPTSALQTSSSAQSAMLHSACCPQLPAHSVALLFVSCSVALLFAAVLPPFFDLTLATQIVTCPAHWPLLP